MTKRQSVGITAALLGGAALECSLVLPQEHSWLQSMGTLTMTPFKIRKKTKTLLHDIGDLIGDAKPNQRQHQTWIQQCLTKSCTIYLS